MKVDVRVSEALLAYGKRVLGSLPSSWQYVRIADLEREGVLSGIQDGNHGGQHPKSIDYVSAGVPFIMAGDLVGERLNTKTCSFLRRDHADSLRIGFAKPGDVLLTHKATLGRTAIVPDGYDYVMLTPQVTYYRIGDAGRLDNKFLMCVFRSPFFRQQLESDSEQSTRKFISVSGQRNLWIPLPPIGEQRAIVEILGAIDDKIQLNRHTNETLEAMTCALFKSWFVDFDPVRAKSEGHKPTGMDAATARLFSSSFVSNAFEVIPDGWEVKPLANVTTLLSRGVGPSYVENDGILVLNQKCIRGGMVDHQKARRHDATVRSVVGRELVLGDVLVNSTGVGTLGRVAQVRQLDEPTIVDSHVTIVRADGHQVLPNVLGLDLYRRELEIESLGEGSTGQTELSRARLGGLLIVVAPIGIQRMFDGAVSPLLDIATANQQQSRILTELRDTLLPKLISGEIRIKDAENLASAAI